MREAERKRLIELLDQNCGYVEEQKAGELADHLLDNGIIVPPCKVGDVVFFVHEMCDENGDEHLGISEGKCVGISMQEEGLWTYCRYENGLTYSHRINEASFLNKDVFPTKSEAEYALKNRRSVSLVDGHIEE